MRDWEDKLLMMHVEFCVNCCLFGIWIDSFYKWLIDNVVMSVIICEIAFVTQLHCYLLGMHFFLLHKIHGIFFAWFLCLHWLFVLSELICEVAFVIQLHCYLLGMHFFLLHKIHDIFFAWFLCLHWLFVGTIFPLLYDIFHKFHGKDVI